jgi:1,2-diacylglycerol 3-beta-galactosyltransferase
LVAWWWWHNNRPGQEEGNIPFVEESGFGKYSNDPQEIATIVTSWLADPIVLQRMQQCAKDAARPYATIQIAQDLIDLLEQQQK